MAVFHLHYHPQKLGISTTVSIVLPLDGTGLCANEGDHEKLPVLWLLHGGGGCHSDMLHQTLVARYAYQYHMAVVMPDGQNSSWVDMAYGPSWETYISEGLPEFIFSHFPVSDKREDNFIAGISMGGYGALHTALRHPDRYAAACGMGSGVWLPIKYAKGLTRDDGLATLDQSLEASFGSDRKKVIGSQYDCIQAAKDALSQGTPLPRLLSCCGKKDFSYAENVAFRDEICALGVDLEWMECEGGHDDESWDCFMPAMFAWLNQR